MKRSDWWVKIQSQKVRITDRGQAIYSRYSRFLPAATFISGVLFDILTLERIDKWSSRVQLGAYLLIVAGLISLEAADLKPSAKAPPWLQRISHYRDEVAHFFLGSLLSAHTIFYFKSMSFWPSLAFFIFVAGLLIGNEMSTLRKLGLPLRAGLFAVCLVSYLACLTPIWWGRLGWWPFLTAVGGAALLGALPIGVAYSSGLMGRSNARLVAIPFSGTLVGFLALYALHLIPPVPLSLTHLGIYHRVERTADGYEVTEMRPEWKFWEAGDQDFIAAPHDRIYCFFSIFSPTGFKDQLRIRWLKKDASGHWQGSDSVPLSITGGREEGYRGYAYKSHYEPGRWQVRIETSDEREIGRLDLNVRLSDAGSDVVPRKRRL